MNCCDYLSCCGIFCNSSNKNQYIQAPLNDHHYSLELKEAILPHISSYKDPCRKNLYIETLDISIMLYKEDTGLYRMTLKYQHQSYKGHSFDGYVEALEDLVSQEGELDADTCKHILEPYS